MISRPKFNRMKPEFDIRAEDEFAPRDTGRAMLRGWRLRCPNCGGGPMMQSYLKVRRTCAACGEPLHHHKADDMPAWATIIVVGHIVVAGMFSVMTNWVLPMWVHWTVWPVLALALTLLILPRIKGMVVGMQWAWRMHGFAGSQPDAAKDPPVDS
ncbi:MAG: DUF983 domain-containing protein [Pseudomonadota bacterium]